MVLDCGGGTIDIAAHRVTSASPLMLKEIEEPTGGAWGSTVVDSKFKAFLKVRRAHQPSVLSVSRNLNPSGVIKWFTRRTLRAKNTVGVALST